MTAFKDEPQPGVCYCGLVGDALGILKDLWDRIFWLCLGILRSLARIFGAFGGSEGFAKDFWDSFEILKDFPTIFLGFLRGITGLLMGI